MAKKTFRIDMRITEEQEDMLQRLMKKKGLPRNPVVSLALKELADRELEHKKKPFPFRDGNK